MVGPATPMSMTSVWALPVSLAATQGISIDFFSSAYLDVSVRQVSLPYPMYSGKDSGGLLPLGFPIRRSPGQCFFQLTEAYRRLRVLHRLLMPRHPPAALSSLTKNWFQLFELAVDGL